MESILSASKSALVSSLDYSLEGNKPPAASYILASHELAAFQRGTQINNPYFGDQMLRCGEVRESFPPLDATPSADTHEGHGDD